MSRLAAFAVVLVVVNTPALPGAIQEVASQPDSTPGTSLPLVDLAGDMHRQVVVDREPGQYLGHPTTALLADGRTVFAVYPKGHGRGALVMKRSRDGGLTWSNRLPVPDSWATSKETPHLYRVEAPDGASRLILFTGLYPIRTSISEDDGATWTEFAPIGDYGGIVAVSDMIHTSGEGLTAFFHDDGRYLRAEGSSTGLFHVYAIDSEDGGVTWSQPRVVAHRSGVHLCEPGIVRSPDGTRLAMLLRENSRTANSHICFSDDEGATWSMPVEMPDSLTGDRHQAIQAEDGRLFISFRDTARDSPTLGDWVGWVGTWEDLAHGRPGQYRVRLMDNHHAWDCAYPALELLPGGTVVATTYGHWTPGESPWIVSVRFTVPELDSILEATP